MKQKLFYLAAVLMFIACSTDQIVEVSENPADLISFRPYINNVTRAADVTTDNLTTFKVNARKSDGNKEYFKDAVFTGSSTTHLPVPPSITGHSLRLWISMPTVQQVIHR